MVSLGYIMQFSTLPSKMGPELCMRLYQTTDPQKERSDLGLGIGPIICKRSVLLLIRFRNVAFWHHGQSHGVASATSALLRAAAICVVGSFPWQFKSQER